MKSLQHILAAVVVLIIGTTQAQQTPGAPQSESILIKGGTAHLGNGDKIEGAAIGFENGKITFIGSDKNVKTSEWGQVVDAEGRHVYPGFICVNSTLGLQEIAAVRATRDHTEVGTFKPNVRSLIAFNTDSEITPTVRSNGVLMGQITPKGGTLSGTSSVVQFDAWNWEDAVIREDDGIHVNWPGVYHKHRDKGKVQIKQVKTYDQTRREIETFFNSAKAYAQVDNPDEVDLKFEALRGVFDGSKTVYVHAQDAKQITEAVNLKKAVGIKKLVIVGGYDSWMIADMLRENDVAVMVRRLHSTPRYTADDIDLPFKLPKLLQDENVLFCLDNSGDMQEMQTRNLPFYAGTAVAYGLTYEQGVQALTLSAAKILGVDETCGSLEKGKDATLFISEGDALDMMTNEVTHAWIQGREMDTDNRQKQLYRKYKAKYDAAK